MPGLPASNPMQSLPAIQGCLEACQRCEALVEIVASSKGAYRSVGRHMRHCLDHFVCLFRGIDSGVVDYDARDRDEQVERDPQYFLNELATIVRRLRTLAPGMLGRKLTLHQQSAPEGRSRAVSSNVERELVFLSGHTIHHLAIMTLLARDHGVDVPEDLATAFSTATYLAGRPAAASGLGHA